MKVEADQVRLIEQIDPDLLVRLSRPGPRYTSFPTAPDWTDAVTADELERRLVLAGAEGPDSPLSLYFHIPFCRKMCTYCGCNVVVARRQDRADRYIEYLEREMDLVCTGLDRRRSVSQIHLGGGTPTYLREEQLLRLWRAITDRFEVRQGAEVALEIDPVVTSREQLALLRGLGFNRVSMGIQDFTPEVQRYVGREQSVELTADLYGYARRLGFSGINFDLIYGLPKQTLETFTRTLETVVEMAPDRVAVFSYAHVPWMRPLQRAFDEALLPSPVDRFELFRAAMRSFMQAGYLQIGMDHFARPEDELSRARLAGALQRNFQGYTVKPASALLAFGITGISEVHGCYAMSVKPLAHYYRALEQGRLPTERGWILTDDDRLRRQVITRIMCNFEVDLDEVCRSFDVDPSGVFAEELPLLAAALEDGLIHLDGLRLELTALGRILVRNVAMVFDPYLRRRQARRGDAGPTFSKTL